MVEAARLAFEERVERVAQLKAAQGRLVQQARELSNARRELAGRLETGLIESLAAGRKWASANELEQLARIDAEHRLVTAANSKVLEHLLPRAEIESLERAAARYRAQAVVLREVAEDRLRRTAEMMSEAAAHEGGIVFDPTQTLSGVLHQQADELDKQAANHQTWAQQKAEGHARLVEVSEAERHAAQV
ncbi:MAG: hypothetical protein ABI823_01120, partial [Bryobacteraceae bacterium]